MSLQSFPSTLLRPSVAPLWTTERYKEEKCSELKNPIQVTGQVCHCMTLGSHLYSLSLNLPMCESINYSILFGVRSHGIQQMINTASTEKNSNKKLFHVIKIISSYHLLNNWMQLSLCLVLCSNCFIYSLYNPVRYIVLFYK